jgi:hypothetical protein
MMGALRWDDLCILGRKLLDIAELRVLCARYWNPIGVPMEISATKDELGFRPLPADEYDGYLLHIASMVDAGAPSSEMREYLELVEREYLMLSRPSGSKDDFVAALVSACRPR